MFAGLAVNKSAHPNDTHWDRRCACGATQVDGHWPPPFILYRHIGFLDHGRSSRRSLFSKIDFAPPSGVHSEPSHLPRFHRPRLSSKWGSAVLVSITGLWCFEIGLIIPGKFESVKLQFFIQATPRKYPAARETRPGSGRNRGIACSSGRGPRRGRPGPSGWSCPLFGTLPQCHRHPAR